ncbi:MAG TPA: hypothetical protein VFM18_17825 [Methanosarcina sp.]|nr:hypothetical protein [Methanosarcina sp.]
MQFKANEDLQLWYAQYHYCGDGCCMWNEMETELVRAGEVYEPNFEYGDGHVDEGYFTCLVKDGVFTPVDAEAEQWVKEQL